MAGLCPKCFCVLPDKANYCPICGECLLETLELESRYTGGEFEKKTVVGIRDKRLIVGEGTKDIDEFVDTFINSK